MTGRALSWGRLVPAGAAAAAMAVLSCGADLRISSLSAAPDQPPDASVRTAPQASDGGGSTGDGGAGTSASARSDEFDFDVCFAGCAGVNPGGSDRYLNVFFDCICAPP